MLLRRLNCEVTVRIAVQTGNRTMFSRLVALILATFLAPTVAFIGVGSICRSAGALVSTTSNGGATCRSPIRPPVRCVGEGGAAEGGWANGEEDAQDAADMNKEDIEGVAKMRAKEIKAELDVRGVSYEGIYEKRDLVDKLIEARSLGKANPSIVDEFNKENLEQKMNPERAGEFEQDLFDQDKLKDMTAADGTLPGGLTPEQLTKMASNPEIMVLLQNPKMQEIMKKIMAGGPEAMETLQEDHETRELLQRLEKAMSTVK